MANHTRSVVVEGCPIYFGDALAWHEGEAVQCLEPMDKRPTVERSIDIMGGVMQWDAMTFDLIDRDDRIAQVLHWGGTPKVKVLSPSPLTSPDDTITTPQVITLDTSTHPAMGALSFTAGAVHPYITVGRSASFMAAMLACSGAWTFTARVKIDTAGTSACLMRTKDDSVKIHLDGDYINLLIDNTVVPIDNTGIGTGWHHVAVRYDGTDYTSWIDGVLDNTVTSAAFTPGSGHVYLFGDGVEADTEAYDIARLAFYGRSLSNAEILADSNGISTSKSNLLYSWNGVETTHGATIVDDSIYCQHAAMIGYTRVARVFIPGDLLYMPQDTARISGLDTGTAQFPCQRQIFSCLEAGWRSYYQCNPYPEAGSANDYVCQAATARPFYYVGRKIAYYIDGVLSYIGTIENIQQNGARWTFETKNILDPLINGFKPMFGGLKLAYEWNIDFFQFKAQRASGGTVLDTGPLIQAGGFSQSELTYILSTVMAPYMFSSVTDGLAYREYVGDAQWIAVNDDDTKGTLDAFSTTPGVLFHSSFNAQGTRAPGDPLPKYGVCANGSVRLHVIWPGSTAVLDGMWLSLGDYKLLVSAAGTSTILGQTVTYIDCIVYDKDLTWIGAKWGLSQNYPIILSGLPIVDANTLYDAIWQVLTSTGAGDNGVFDILPGYLGMGIPADLIDQGDHYQEFITAVFCDLSDGKIGEDLAALGYGLIFEDGVFSIKKISAPVMALTTGAVNEANRLTNQTVGSSWGNFSPVNAISYETDAGFIDVVAYLDNINTATDRRLKQFKTACRIKLTDAQRNSFVTNSFKRLQWLSSYAPTLTVTLPGHNLSLGQTVSVSVRSVAGQGRYNITDVPALVQRIGSDYSVNLVLNTSDTSSNAAWVPSWEIVSYSGTALTLRYQEGLQFDKWALPITGQIIASTGQVLEASVDIHSASASVVTVHTAPTYDQTIYKGILTLPNYTSALAADVLKYVWGSDAGAMSDATDGKVML